MARKSVVKTSGISDDYKQIDPSKIEEIVVYERKRPRKKKPKNNTISAAELTKRIEALARPRHKVKPEDAASNQSSVLSTPFSTKCRVSKRIKMLAEPRWKNHKYTEEDQESTLSHSSVAQSALSYMPTKRIIELARPKGFGPYDMFDYKLYDTTNVKRYQT